MAWKCNQCSNSSHGAGAIACDHCGGIPATLILRGATGQVLEIRVPTDLGRRTLGALVGEDARGLADVQFRVFRDESRGAWFVQAGGATINQTYCDGVALGGEPHPLGLGTKITVGERGRACIQIDFAS